MKDNRKLHVDTLALHAGYDFDPVTNSCAVPIYQTTAYVFNDSQHAADLFELKKFGNIYSRIGNPTCDILEKRVAAMEGGAASVAVSSGMAAISSVILTLCQAGDNIVASNSLYGGTVTLLSQNLVKYGITTTFVEGGDPQNFAKAINEKTKIVYIESLANPRNNVLDYDRIAQVAHEKGVALVCDNTVTSPILFNPIEHGADIVVHSCTKLFDGQGCSVGGIVVDSGKFPWDNGRYPAFTKPDPSYHGIVYYEQFKEIAFIVKLRTQTLRDFGMCMSPFNAFQFINGLGTLHLRIIKQSENALELARYLEKHPLVSWVNYPGLKSHPDYKLAEKYFPKGKGAILGFGIKGGIEAGKKFIENVKIAKHLANLLDSRTLVIHPASTTHQQLSEAEQLAGGVTPDFIRVSVGSEHIDDIKADFDSALKASQ
jgi:O-acetylhomoserine (thiol)-lyase